MDNVVALSLSELPFDEVTGTSIVLVTALIKAYYLRRVDVRLLFGRISSFPLH